jgi:hypothetical protein
VVTLKSAAEIGDNGGLPVRVGDPAWNGLIGGNPRLNVGDPGVKEAMNGCGGLCPIGIGC